MAKRLISLRELDGIEGLVEHHRKVQERIEAFGGDAAQFDTSVPGALELVQKANCLKRELVVVLEDIAARLKG